LHARHAWWALAWPAIGILQAALLPLKLAFALLPIELLFHRTQLSAQTLILRLLTACAFSLLGFFLFLLLDAVLLELLLHLPKFFPQLCLGLQPERLFDFLAYSFFLCFFPLSGALLDHLGDRLFPSRACTRTRRPIAKTVADSTVLLISTHLRAVRVDRRN